MITTISFPKPELHLFVCINERPKENPTPSCCPRITPEGVTELKKWLAQNGLASRVYCTKAKCLGFCNPESSVAVLYPEGIFFKYSTIDDLKKLISQKISEGSL